MTAPRDILLLNPNATEAATARMAAIARETLGQGWIVREATNPDAPPIIVDPPGLIHASRTTLALFDAGLDPGRGVIVSAFLDPSRAALAERLPVPVVGIAEAAMAEAAGHGRFAILATTPGLSDQIMELVSVYGHAATCLGVVGIEEDPHEVMGDPIRLDAALRALMVRAVDTLGAEAVIVGGGPLADAARNLVAVSPVPVIEPVPAAARRMARLLGAPLG